MLTHPSPGSMMALLMETGENRNCTHDETLQYLFFLLSKVALNTLVLSFWLRSITQSFFGILSISVYLADLLLIGAISWIWLFRQNLETHTSLCFSLAHSSAVYSFLPLPVLLAGTMDYAACRDLDASHYSLGRTAGRCVVVLLIWSLALTYSYWFTNTDLLMIQYREGMKALVCPVQGSTMVSYFNLNLCIVLAAILLLYCRKVPHWVNRANTLSKQRAWPLVAKSDLAFSNMPEELNARREEETCVGDDEQDHPPLFVSLTLCFALNWTPYLIMSAACDLLAFAVPAYTTVNLLWTACVNSLLAGMTFWYNSDERGPFCQLPDDICMWSFYWSLSKENCQWPISTKHNNKLNTLTERRIHYV